MKDERTGAVQAYAVQYLKPEWKILDPSLRADFARLEKLHDGVPMVDSRDRADRTWVVRYVVDDGPDTYYLWHRATQRAESLFVNVPEWLNQPFTHTQLVTVRARDGLELPCYLTLPPGVAPKNLLFQGSRRSRSFLLRRGFGGQAAALRACPGWAVRLERMRADPSLRSG